MIFRYGLLLGSLLALMGRAPLAAQGGAALRGSDVTMLAAYQQASAFESAGQSARAAELLRTILDKSPSDFRALSLMERVTARLDRRADMLPLIARAMQVDSIGTGLMGIAVRVYAGLLLPDSAARYARRWLTKVPGDPSPYREWSDAATEVRDRTGALAALEEGRRQLGHAASLAPEIAQALQMNGNYSRATGEWIIALDSDPLYRRSAVFLLGQVPQAQRETVSQLLTRSPSNEAHWLNALLLVHWGKAVEGTTLIRTSLPKNPPEALALLDELLEDLSGSTERTVLLAKATVLEAMAQRESGPTVPRRRMEAAKAYADAGSDRDARRLIGLVSADPTAPAGATSAASATLLGVLIAEGKATEAEKMLGTLGTSVGDEERDDLRHRIALLWARQGEYDHAERLIGVDSSISGIDLAGRIRLFRGDLAGAASAFRFAGPFDDVRTQSVSRVAILALLQTIGLDSSVAVGHAFLALERGDSATALRLFDSLATGFPVAGAAETRLLGGRLAVSLGDSTRALALFTAADVPALPGTAAAARLERARLLAARGRGDEARRLAESVILDFPESTVLPDARRLRDELRGAVPVRNR